MGLELGNEQKMTCFALRGMVVTQFFHLDARSGLWVALGYIKSVSRQRPAPLQGLLFGKAGAGSGGAGYWFALEGRKGDRSS